MDIQKKLDETAEKTSALAWKIQDKPQFELDRTYKKYIEEYKK